MLKYIDADSLIKDVEKESNQDGSYGYMDTESIVDLINNAPTADVVEVGRCEKCNKWKRDFSGGNYGYCYRDYDLLHTTYESDYCSWWEKKERRTNE